MKPRPIHLSLLLIAAALPGCVEERIVSYNPPLAGLPNAVTGQEPVLPPSRGGIQYIPDEKTLVEKPDGSKELLARAPRQLMRNIVITLDEDLPELFVRDVLSERTRQEFIQRGLNPLEAFTTLKAQREDIQALFDFMPAGELTPGLFLTTIGPNTFRLKLDGRPARTLPLIGFDMVFERGNFRLRWFIPRGSRDPG